ncbi:MAG: Gfo/Idh/MocA family oxidoreductase [Actinobacteria bacterium]|nr:Gfo/Idh/MocA family oxidoreductase [Actinomycetota bacterium]
MTQPIRWGILATGWIAGLFAHDLRLLPDAELVAVGSRTQESADRFGDEFDVPRRYGSYQALIDDADVDVLYIAPPHPMHFEPAMAAMRAGRPVLLEKPFTMDADEAARLIDAASESDVFLMEAMWTRWLPHIVRVREILAEGTLGEVISVTAEHGQYFERDPRHRIFAPELGGGALLDLGIYPLSFASMVLGTPSRISAVSTPAFTGVDAQTSMLLQYDSGAHAVLTTTSYAATENRAAINGIEARIEIERTFYTPTSFKVISRTDEVLESYDVPDPGRGMQHQAAEVGRCLRAGLRESPALPLAETLSIMQTMDEVRRQIGLTYPATP